MLSRVSQWLELMALGGFLSSQVSFNCRHLVFNCPLVLTSLSSLAGNSNLHFVNPDTRHKSPESGIRMGGRRGFDSMIRGADIPNEWNTRTAGMVSGVIALTGNFMSWDLLCCCQIERERYNKTWIRVIVGLSLINIDVEFIDGK